MPSQPILGGPYRAGVAALEARRFDEALVHFAAALVGTATGAERALVQNKVALSHLGRGDRPAAIAAFSDALDANPQCVPVIVNVGNLLFEDGMVADAVDHYEAALRIDDSYAAGYVNAGIAYKRLGRVADAVRAFRRANSLEARRRPR